MRIESLAFQGAEFLDEQARPLFTGLDFEFPMHEVVLIEGAAGSGKSLLLKAMGGLVLPSVGHYLINGVNVSALSFYEFLPYRLSIGYSFESGGLISDKTLRDNLLLPLQYHRLISDKESVNKVDELIETFGLASVQHVIPADLSSSFKRLAVVARSLIFDPELLLLDHPTTGLSDADRLNLASVLKEKQSKGQIKHIFMISRQDVFIDNLVTCRISTEDNAVRSI